MSCLLLSQNIVFCKSSLLCKLWALLGHGARIAHQERSLTTNLNAANNYKAASCFWGWGWSQEQDGFFGGVGSMGFVLFFCPSSLVTFLHHLLGQTLWQFLQFSQQSWWVDQYPPPKNHDQWGAQTHRWFQADHLKANMATLSAAKIVYSAGFFITVSPESMEMLGVPKAQIRPTVVGGVCLDKRRSVSWVKPHQWF